MRGVMCFTSTLVNSVMDFTPPPDIRELTFKLVLHIVNTGSTLCLPFVTTPNQIISVCGDIQSPGFVQMAQSESTQL